MSGRNRRRLPWVAVMLSLLGCSACTATIGTEAPKPREVKTVGVISAVGDTLMLTRAGLTGLGNGEQRVYSIESWGIDDLIVRRAGSLLSGRFQVKPVTYKRAAFAALERNNPVVMVNLLRKDRIKDLVRTEAAPQGLDVYVVITKGTSLYGSGGRYVGGIGIISHSALLKSYNQLHALYVVTVVDGHALGVLEKRPAAPLDNTEIVRLGGPSRMVDDAFLPTATEAAENEKLKAGVTDLIERSLTPTLESLRLFDPS
jgi:hypothetical protein